MQDEDYQSALRVLRNQRNALERTPSVAAKLDGEEIRDMLLVGLNAQFEGDAGANSSTAQARPTFSFASTTATSSLANAKCGRAQEPWTMR